MPKETVRSSGQTMTIGWTKEQGCQIGVDVFGNKFVFLDRAGQPMTDEAFDSLWFTVTERKDFNQIIRALKKARDKVCGKDA